MRMCWDGREENQLDGFVSVWWHILHCCENLGDGITASTLFAYRLKSFAIYPICNGIGRTEGAFSWVMQGVVGLNSCNSDVILNDDNGFRNLQLCCMATCRFSISRTCAE